MNSNHVSIDKFDYIRCDTRTAIDDGPMCAQRNSVYRSKEDVGTEDCLRLNVYVPETVKSLASFQSVLVLSNIPTYSFPSFYHRKTGKTPNCRCWYGTIMVHFYSVRHSDRTTLQISYLTKISFWWRAITASVHLGF